MPTPAKCFTALLIAFALAGCAGHSHRLASGNALEGVAGFFNHEGSQEPTMVLVIDGIRFEGSGFEIKRGQNLPELRRMFGPGKHYDRIISSLDTDHLVYSASPELRAKSGETIRCLLVWNSGQGPAGVCTKADGKQLDVRFE